MKKIISAILVMAMVLGCCSFCFASSSNQSAVIQAVKALGIMEGYSNGSMGLEKNLTRAHFAKMLAVASEYSDEIQDGGSGYTLFSDVSKSYWANKYISVTASHGWFMGYSDGTFRPKANIKLEQAVACLMRMIGYDSSTLKGSYPTAQLNKAEELGLLDNVSAKRGEYITRGDCANLFYNALCAETPQGSPYAESIGCTVTNGKLDYSSAVDTDSDGIYVGMVLSSSKNSGSGSSASVTTTVTVNCTDGAKRSFDLSYSTEYTQGSLVRVVVSDGTASVASLTETSISGKVNAAGTYLDSTKLADGVMIIDSDDYGNMTTVDIDTIAGKTLLSSQVRYYELDSDGRITLLILDDATGELWSFGYLSSAESSSGSNMSVSGSYTLLTGGTSKTIRTTNVAYAVDEGGAAVKYDSSGEVKGMKQLKEVSVSVLSSAEILSGNTRYTLDDDCDIYLYGSGEYLLTDIASVNTNDYYITAWCDTDSFLTAKARVLVAVKR